MTDIPTDPNEPRQTDNSSEPGMPVLDQDPNWKPVDAKEVAP